jgi:SAM-dependent methyltransferase
MDDPQKCCICGNELWRLFKESSLAGIVSPDDFRITDSRYGVTGRICKCMNCGFKQVSDVKDVLSFYEALEDEDYDSNRKQRGLQARSILKKVQNYIKRGRLLDVGAASGILLEQGVALGYDCEGVEPSKALSAIASRNGQKVHLGILPHPDVSGKYDVITLVDVIEHIPNPVQLLRDIAAHLKPTGFGVLTTPNEQSLVAKLLGGRWWHYRIAHIGYFNLKTIKLALSQAGLEVVSVSSPPWFFSFEYAYQRAMFYLPIFQYFGFPQWIKNKTIRINFFDSMQIIFRIKKRI